VKPKQELDVKDILQHFGLTLEQWNAYEASRLSPDCHYPQTSAYIADNLPYLS
jgi:hypothetical protein